MIPVAFPEANTELGRSQNEYEPLPVYRFKDPEGRVVLCCRLSPAELDEINRTRTIWLQQLTFGSPFQPIAMSTLRPADLPKLSEGGKDSE